MITGRGDPSGLGNSEAPSNQCLGAVAPPRNGWRTYPRNRGRVHRALVTPKENRYA
jgi:hypothetical protein